MEEDKKNYKFYVSSWHCKKNDANCVGVVEKQVAEQPDGSKIEKDVLKLYKDPIRPFWITKPQFQMTYDHKKEFEDIDKLDLYQCRDSELEDSLARALGLPISFRRRDLRMLCSSPYVTVQIFQ